MAEVEGRQLMPKTVNGEKGGKFDQPQLIF